MWRQLCGVLLVGWGLAGALYLTWCQYRGSVPVIMADRAWPRPWPYPDRWVARLYADIDAANPCPPGYHKMDGEWYRLETRLMGYTLAALVVVAVGGAVLLWPPRRPPSRWDFARWDSFRRGLAIGLVVGVCWVALLGNLADEWGPGWRELVVYTAGCFITGGVIGAVRAFPECVGLGTGLLALSVLASLEALLDNSGWPRGSPSCDDVGGFLLVACSGSLAGCLTGLLHRCSRPKRSAPVCTRPSLA